MREMEHGWSDCHSERGLTAALPGAFEARNGLFDRRPVIRENGGHLRLCRGLQDGGRR